MAAPQVAGPITPAFGNLVATPRGLAPINLEGFSEDLNQDGFVDPVAQVAPVVHAPVVHAPVFRAAPFVHAAPLAFRAPFVHAAPAAFVRHF